MTSPPDLSIVIPAFNEERRLPKTLDRIHDYLGERGWRAEVIVVDDGSTDGTAKLVEQFRQKYPEVRLVSNDRNRGKGFSVRHGMLEAGGEIALFTDADLSAPIEEAEKLLGRIRENGCAGAIGSRAVDRTLIEVHQPRFRELMGIVFNKAVRFITGVRFVDTQCGFKAFRREPTRIIFEQQRIEGFGFDPEILFLAQRHGLAVIEVPVRWVNDPASKIHVVSDSARMFLALLGVRWNALRGRYPPREGSRS
jgi:glycosyltransferase involved in cell wall biosynthesis